jgi:hypothetical protein
MIGGQVHTFTFRMRRSRLRVFAHEIAKVLGAASLAIIALIATPSSGHPPLTRFDALPLAEERLPHPVWLPHCGMTVVEWRPTPALLAETSVGDAGLSVIDSTCSQAVARYGAFLQARGIRPIRSEPKNLPTISLLPGNVLLDGLSLRALNDLGSRFQAVAPGCCYWGLYVDSINHIFLRNDPLTRGQHGSLEPNPRFVRTLTHELSHVLSLRLGVWDVTFDRERDELLAEQFVAFMGMQAPVESSSEDLDLHLGVTRPTGTRAIGIASVAP